MQQFPFICLLEVLVSVCFSIPYEPKILHSSLQLVVHVTYLLPFSCAPPYETRADISATMALWARPCGTLTVLLEHGHISRFKGLGFLERFVLNYGRLEVLQKHVSWGLWQSRNDQCQTAGKNGTLHYCSIVHPMIIAMRTCVNP